MENNAAKTTSLPLSIHGETFNALKCDFDADLRGLVGTMIAKGSEEAKISIGLKITLAKDQAPEWDEDLGQREQYCVKNAAALAEKGK